MPTYFKVYSSMYYVFSVHCKFLDGVTVIHGKNSIIFMGNTSKYNKKENKMNGIVQWQFYGFWFSEFLVFPSAIHTLLLKILRT